jgi:hypothetical protein
MRPARIDVAEAAIPLLGPVTEVSGEAGDFAAGSSSPSQRFPHEGRCEQCDLCPLGGQDCAPGELIELIELIELLVGRRWKFDSPIAHERWSQHVERDGMNLVSWGLWFGPGVDHDHNCFMLVPSSDEVRAHRRAKRIVIDGDVPVIYACGARISSVAPRMSAADEADVATILLW